MGGGRGEDKKSEVEMGRQTEKERERWERDRGREFKGR